MSSKSSTALRHGHGHGHGQKDDSKHSDANRPYPVEPIPIVDHQAIPARRNVDKWFKDAEDGGTAALELSLFIRAMTKFQALEPRDQLSYFRIAGIHGFPPNVSWNMEQEPIPYGNKIPKGKGGYYCAHESYRFGTWHRVYLILFERRVSDLMKEEAMTMDVQDEGDRSIWEHAASNWRLPYWDWAGSPLPKLLSTEFIYIASQWNSKTKCVDKDSKVPNPMYSFRMPGGKAMGDKAYGDYRIDGAEGIPFDLCKGTSRHGINWYNDRDVWIEGITNVDELNDAIENPEWPRKRFDTIRDAVQRLLNPEYNATWEQFISTKYQGQNDNPKEYLSLEAIHNNLHNWIGGSDPLRPGGAGHMHSVPVASFDPIFWLHHCNIDRIMYLWQSIEQNRKKWFQSTPKHGDDDKTPLRPFRTPKDPAAFYDSNQVRYLKSLNYTYDDPIDPEDPSKLTAYINKLYGEKLDKVKDANGEELPDDPDENGAQNVDFIINVIYNRYALDGHGYLLRFFLERECVGSIYTFSTPIRGEDGSVRCHECAARAEKKILSRAQVPILRAVRARVEPARGESFDDYTERVHQYLKRSLRWVATLNNGAEISKAALPDVKVDVLAGIFKPRKDKYEFVKFSDHRLLMENVR